MSVNNLTRSCCFSPPLLEIIKESRLSSDYHHPSSSVKNATLFSPLLLVFLPSMEKRERFRVRLTNRRNLPRVRGSKRFFERSFFLWTYTFSTFYRYLNLFDTPSLIASASLDLFFYFRIRYFFISWIELEKDRMLDRFILNKREEKNTIYSKQYGIFDLQR